MLMPRKVRHRKTHRGRMTGASKGGTKITFGDFGIQALEPGWITNRQIEAARIAMTRYIKRGGKVWINIFPDKPVTQKPAEATPVVKEADPEFERLLAEEEEIERRTRQHHEAPKFHGDSED